MQFFKEVFIELQFLQVRQGLKRSHLGQLVIGNQQMLQMTAGLSKSWKGNELIMIQIQELESRKINVHN
jgi:hypothetical protein